MLHNLAGQVLLCVALVDELWTLSTAKESNAFIFILEKNVTAADYLEYVLICV